MTLLERLREAQQELDAARKVRPSRCGSEQMARDEWAGDALPELLAVVDAAQAFCENCLGRAPSALLGTGEEQPDNVWFVGSARDLGLPLLDALAALNTGESPDSPPKEVSE